MCVCKRGKEGGRDGRGEGGRAGGEGRREGGGKGERGKGERNRKERDGGGNRERQQERQRVLFKHRVIYVVGPRRRPADEEEGKGRTNSQGASF